MTLFSISADSHVTEPGDCYLDRIDPRSQAVLAEHTAHLGPDVRDHIVRRNCARRDGSQRPGELHPDHVK